MSTKHTPGPWTAFFEESQVSGVNVTFGIYSEHRISIASGQSQEHLGEGYGIHQDECEANARLIAAAPELLEALIAAREFISTDRNSLADCAIDFDGHMSDDDAAAVADYDKALMQIDAAIAKATGSAT